MEKFSHNPPASNKGLAQTPAKTVFQFGPQSSFPRTARVFARFFDDSTVWSVVYKLHTVNGSFKEATGAEARHFRGVRIFFNREQNLVTAHLMPWARLDNVTYAMGRAISGAIVVGASPAYARQIARTVLGFRGAYLDPQTGRYLVGDGLDAGEEPLWHVVQ